MSARPPVGTDRPCILTDTPGCDPDDCTTHGHERAGKRPTNLTAPHGGIDYETARAMMAGWLDVAVLVSYAGGRARYVHLTDDPMRADSILVTLFGYRIVTLTPRGWEQPTHADHATVTTAEALSEVTPHRWGRVGVTDRPSYPGTTLETWSGIDIENIERIAPDGSIITNRKAETE